MKKDSVILRELAKLYLEIANDPIQRKKRERYRLFNDMHDVGHMVLIEPDVDGAWKEIIPEDELKTMDPTLRECEFLLRRMIYHAQNFHDDQIFEPYVSMDMAGEYTGYHYGNSSQKSAWGLPIPDMSVRQDGGSYAMNNLLSSPEDYETVLNHKLEFRYDREETERKKEKVEDALGGILNVKLRVPYSALVCSLLIELVHLRGMTQLMLDAYDNPEQLKAIMRHMSDEKTRLLEKLESDGILVLNNDNVYTGSGGTAYTTRLPADGFSGKVRLKDIWGFADAQEFAMVSNEMFKEFVLPYQVKPLSKFGLACYGCCEKVDEKLADILAIPNIWRISVSPWSDIHTAAEKIGRKAIYSRKPNPAAVSKKTDPDFVKQDLKAVLEAAAGCQVEFILKDLRTCNNNPENLKQWVDIAKSLS